MRIAASIDDHLRPAGSTRRMKLADDAFTATCVAPMRRLDADATPPVAFWAYVDAIPLADFEGHDCSDGRVTHVWASADGAYQHVLVDSEAANVFMVIVLDVAAGCVVGHRLLDLDRAYGLAPPSLHSQPGDPLREADPG